MAEAAPDRYRPQDLIKVRGNIGKFFRFVFQDQHFEDLDQIRPSTVSRFIDVERARGLSSHIFLGHLSTFFVWVTSLGLYDRGNPVVNRVHRPQMMFGRDSLTSSHRVS
jgi:hypothetical protein